MQRYAPAARAAPPTAASSCTRRPPSTRAPWDANSTGSHQPKKPHADRFPTCRVRQRIEQIDHVRVGGARRCGRAWPCRGGRQKTPRGCASQATSPRERRAAGSSLSARSLSAAPCSSPSSAPRRSRRSDRSGGSGRRRRPSGRASPASRDPGCRARRCPRTRSGRRVIRSKKSDRMFRSLPWCGILSTSTSIVPPGASAPTSSSPDRILSPRASPVSRIRLPADLGEHDDARQVRDRGVGERRQRAPGCVSFCVFRNASCSFCSASSSGFIGPTTVIVSPLPMLLRAGACAAITRRCRRTARSASAPASVTSSRSLMPWPTLARTFAAIGIEALGVRLAGERRRRRTAL